MRSGSAGGASGRRRAPVGLVFCEDENDAYALRNLAGAIRADLPRIDYCRRPLILIRDRKRAEERKRNASLVQAAVRARQVVAEVKFVIAHQDCDDFEPAHIELAKSIEDELVGAGLANVVSVAPAWETEAWWYLWPDAVAAVNKRWRRLNRTGNHGLIKDAKESLRRDLRAEGARDYEESDSRAISSNVRSMGLVDLKVGASQSFEDYATKIKALAI